MSKELRRLLELSGVKDKNQLVASLYENYYSETEIDGQGPVKGLEGPFKMKNGRVVYYDPKEGKYYDHRSDIYLSQEEADALHEVLAFVQGVVLHAIRGDDKLNLRLEYMSEMRPMITLLRNNGYDDFEYSDGAEDRQSYDDEMDDDSMGGGDPIHDIHATVDRLMGAMGAEQELSPEVKDHLAQAAEHLGMAADELAGGGEMDQDEVDVDVDVSVDDENGVEHEHYMESKQLKERELSDDEKGKLDRLKKKHEGGPMQTSMHDQYGKEKGDDVFYGKLTKMAKEGVEEFEEELEESGAGRKGDLKVTPSTSRGLDKKQQKAARSKERQQGRRASLDEHAKGAKVKYGNKEVYVVVPNAQGDQVGISDTMDGKVDLVDSDKLSALVKEVAVKKVKGAYAVSKTKKVEEDAVSATVYDNDAMPADAVDDAYQKGERTGEVDRTETKNVVPTEVIASIDQRLSELKKSVERYDGKGYNEKSVKSNSIEALQQIKKNLQRGDHEGFMEAQIYFGTLMSPIWDMIPAQVVNYLHKGDDSLTPDAA